MGGSYYFITESAKDSPPYMLLGTQALDGIGMQLLWVSDILLSFICSVDNLIILEIYCESLSGRVNI